MLYMILPSLCKGFFWTDCNLILNKENQRKHMSMLLDILLPNYPTDEITNNSPEPEAELIPVSDNKVDKEIGSFDELAPDVGDVKLVDADIPVRSHNKIVIKGKKVGKAKVKANTS